MTELSRNKEKSIRFAGYAGLFGIADASHDTIRPGAFSQSLAKRTQPLPLLWQHQSHQPIGYVEYVNEDARGLRVIAKINQPDSRAASMLRARNIDGLSFGYRAREANQTPTGRELIRIDLFEISLVTHPLQHGARVHFLN